MPEILLGAAILIGALVLLRLFVTANPSTLVKAIRYAGVVVLVLAAALLVYLREIGYAFIVAGMAWGLYTNGHIWPAFNFGPFGMFRYGATAGRRRRSGSKGSSQSGQTSRVATDWVEIELDHDTGEMQGNVLKGRFASKPLAALSPDDLVALYGEAGTADGETARLLEAYLDRRLGAEWRLKQQEQPKSDEKPRSRRDSAMSRDEAYSVLGLKPGASEDEVRAAHKKLMMQNHPDKGGTDYLASKINEAKDVLLN
jgi:hypothetical protein